MASRGGQPGNQNAVKNRPITELITRALLANNAEKARALAESLIERAIAESDRAAEAVMDRVEGKVPQSLTGPDGGPLQVQDVPWLGGRGVARR